jgi:DNA-binding response OmpR family regulator
MAEIADEPDQPSADPVESTVLLIEDDVSIRAFVRNRLEIDGYHVTEAASGEEGLEKLTPSTILVIVDVGLPGIDGFGVVRAMRRISRVPIVMMTAAADEGDRVFGLELGADDYIIKPFLPREMMARVRAAIRRGSPLQSASGSTEEPAAIVESDGLSIDPAAREALVDGVLLPLTAREFELLRFLAESPRQVFSREQLLRQVWEVEPGWLGTSTVTEHVHRVRRQLESHSGTTARIVTVRGAGYRFDPK